MSEWMGNDNRAIAFVRVSSHDKKMICLLKKHRLNKSKSIVVFLV